MSREPSLHIIAGGRRSGKTTRMLELLRGTPSGLLVVRSMQEAKILRDMGYHERVVSHHDIKRGELRGRDPRLLIDNAEWLLREAIGGPYEIAAVSFTAECEVLSRNEKAR